MVLKSLILSLILKSSVSFVIRRIKYYLFIYSFIYLFIYLFIYHITSVPSLQDLYARIRSGSQRFIMFQLTDPTLKNIKTWGCGWCGGQTVPLLYSSS